MKNGLSDQAHLSGVVRTPQRASRRILKPLVFLGHAQSTPTHDLSGSDHQAYWNGVFHWFQSGITNEVLEGINSLIQAAKAKARSYRSTRNLITIVYFVAENSIFPLPIHYSEEPGKSIKSPNQQ